MKIVFIVLLALGLLFAGLCLLMELKTWRMKGENAPTSHKASKKRIRAGEKTVLYFYTPSCGACRMQGPIIQRIQKRYSDAVFKIDASHNREAAAPYGVMGVPFMAFINDGTIVKAKAGVQSEPVIEGFLTES
ncbi:MAG: thioredoxin family protein [Deltaproteobacteria bacterium]|nr:thioredoxin family protein [Deltaproteobacteria bacterium]